MGHASLALLLLLPLAASACSGFFDATVDEDANPDENLDVLPNENWDLNECCDACTSREDCAGYVMVTSEVTSQCYLKGPTLNRVPADPAIHNPGDVTLFVLMPPPPPSSPPLLPPPGPWLPVESCPWRESRGYTSRNNMLRCFDGSFCNTETEGHACCTCRGGRYQCPYNRPYMCADTTCADIDDQSTDHCCVERQDDCKGGLRDCPSPHPAWVPVGACPEGTAHLSPPPPSPPPPLPSPPPPSWPPGRPEWVETLEGWLIFSLALALFLLAAVGGYWHWSLRAQRKREYNWAMEVVARKLADEHMKADKENRLRSKDFLDEAEKLLSLQNVAEEDRSQKWKDNLQLADGFKHHIFLSYRVDSDRPLAMLLYYMLSARGLSVWWDKKNMDRGVKWESQLAEGIHGAQIFMPIMSRAGLARMREMKESSTDNVLLEYRLALSMRELRETKRQQDAEKQRHADAAKPRPGRRGQRAGRGTRAQHNGDGGSGGAPSSDRGDDKIVEFPRILPIFVGDVQKDKYVKYLPDTKFSEASLLKGKFGRDHHQALKNVMGKQMPDDFDTQCEAAARKARGSNPETDDDSSLALWSADQIVRKMKAFHGLFLEGDQMETVEYSVRELHDACKNLPSDKRAKFDWSIRSSTAIVMEGAQGAVAFVGAAFVGALNRTRRKVNPVQTAHSQKTEMMDVKLMSPSTKSSEVTPPDDIAELPEAELESTYGFDLT